MGEFSRRQVVGGALAVGGVASFAGQALAQAPQTGFDSKIALTENRIWMAVNIEKKGPYLFILDTGSGTNLIKEDIAEKLKLKKMADHRIGGIGGSQKAVIYSADEITFGNGIRLPNVRLTSTTAQLGKDAAGAFAAGLFTTFDSDLDFDAGEWRAYPKGRPNRDGFKPIRSRFSKTGWERIYVQASLGDFVDEFILDTGAPGAVLLDGAAANKSGLWDDNKPYAPAETRGFGPKAIPTRMVRIPRLKIGPYVFERTLVRLQKPGELHGSTIDEAGLIGLNIIAQLNLSTDVKNGIIWAAPNGKNDEDDHYAMAGLWFDREGDVVTISDVGTGSPAAAAGLKVGDVVMGKSMGDLIRMANGPAGSVMAFDYVRNGEKKRAEFTLADYL